MKKALIVLLLLAVVAGGLFAQLTKEIVVDYVPDLFLYQSTHAKDSQINFLTSETFDTSEMRLNLTYVNDIVKAFLQVKMDGLISRTGGFSGNAWNLNNILTSNFGDYYVEATANNMFGGNYKFYLGNTANRGVTDRFQDFHDFLRTKSDNFGIQIPNISIGGPAGVTAAILDTDTNNFQANKFKHALNNGISPDEIASPWVGLFATYDPFTIAIGGSMADPKEAGESYRKINGSIRFSAASTADKAFLNRMLAFDVIYRLWNYDSNTIDNYEENWPIPVYDQPDGQGITTHNFGAYATISLLQGQDAEGKPKSDLGISVGYSGSIRMDEDEFVRGVPNVTADVTNVTKNPFFNGIDLRFKYTGIENLIVTFNNNFSIAGVTGADPVADHETVNGFVGTVGKDGKQSYFALYNALGAAYKLSAPLTLKAQIGSRLLSYKETYSSTGYDSEDKIFYNRLGVALFAQYAFSARMEFRFGLDFINDYTKYTQTQTNTDDQEDSIGTFTFGIPIGVLLKF